MATARYMVMLWACDTYGDTHTIQRRIAGNYEIKFEIPSKLLRISNKLWKKYKRVSKLNSDILIRHNTLGPSCRGELKEKSDITISSKNWSPKDEELRTPNSKLGWACVVAQQFRHRRLKWPYYYTTFANPVETYGQQMRRLQLSTPTPGVPQAKPASSLSHKTQHNTPTTESRVSS
jgi:hypothetical protein